MSSNRVPRMAIFNHKGGVGKTTLTANLAFALSDISIRVLLVDSDPQGNLTAHLIDDPVVNDLLDKSDGPEGTTLWSALKPVVEGEGDVRIVAPIELPGGTMLIPGDIRLAEFESELSTYWTECFARRARGFRGTTALSRLIDKTAESIGAHIVLYDTGPNIGPLNRAILLDCDYFVVPAACDLFSLRAIKTLGRTLASWISEWKTISEFAPESAPMLLGLPKPLGYVAQRFRIYGGKPSMVFAELMPRLEKAFQEDLLTLLGRIDADLISRAVAPLRIGEIKDFGQLASASQQEGVAIWNVSYGTDAQRSEARADFHELAAEIARRAQLPAA